MSTVCCSSISKILLSKVNMYSLTNADETSPWLIAEKEAIEQDHIATN